MDTTALTATEALALACTPYFLRNLHRGTVVDPTPTDPEAWEDLQSRLLTCACPLIGEHEIDQITPEVATLAASMAALLAGCSPAMCSTARAVVAQAKEASVRQALDALAA